ncbi:conserved hypothetical protein [Methanoregula boonei 6A8]|jgi:hypothetical protein|uniref:Uncharacterized protein n=1 Tax=Methanoregula boonei (strain DSM 21154 / JCM 14090 / 6A8) TaxID=456442 RepID=A7I4J3_METB6|nr:hypothetical protein [Methanoregula boonei]ABS54654.1 conserved hypothetical protein [Methanoregula boonei 6A8]
MAGLKDDAQWIVMMGFVVSFSLFFLAMVLNQSTVVGQTTAESVLDFPKNDIRDVRSVIIDAAILNSTGNISASQTAVILNDTRVIELSRKEAVISYQITPPNPPADSHTYVNIHYNNGVTAYNETWVSS